MEPITKQAFTVNDLPICVTVFHMWSRLSFQNLFESGFLRDIAEAIKTSDYDKKGRVFLDILKPSVGRSHYEDSEGVSFKQMIKAFELILVDDVNLREKFLDAIFDLGYSSSWFEKNKLTWEMRDEWRKKIGLKRLNPVLENNTGLKIVFKIAGHCDVWKKPPECYRYATVQEVSGLVSLPDQNRCSVIFHDGKWRELKKTKLGNISWEEVFKNPEIFFHSNVFYVPLVKL